MSINILVVDDNPIIRHGIRICIEARTDWKICGEAGNGKVAIEMVRDLRPDLVLLDLAMPLMNGLEAAQEISKITPNLPMIMFTMLDCNELLKAAAAAVGIRRVFSKSDQFDEHVLPAIRELFPAA